MTISRVDFCSFIIEFTTRNPNLGLPALEDGLCANSLIFDYLHNEENSRKGRKDRKGRKGWKGRKGRKGRKVGKVGMVGNMAPLRYIYI